MINLVAIDGTLGRDAEQKFTTTGKPVTNFSIAVDNGFGENKKDPFWFNVVAWGELAEAAGKLSKGSKVTIYGRLTSRKYTNKAQVEITVTEIVANAFEVRKTDNRSSESRGNSTVQGRPQQTQQVADEDIPF